MHRIFRLLSLVLLIGCGGKDNGTDSDDPVDSSSAEDTGAEEDFDRDGFTVEQGDCDDNNPDVYPYANEVCDGVDNDCDGLVDDDDDYVRWNADTYYQAYHDVDGDTYGSITAGMRYFCNDTPLPDEGYSMSGGDCDDSDASVNPGATEVCDGVDNDCDGLLDDRDDSIDVSTQTLYYQDLDGDGHGNSSVSELSCEQPLGYVLIDGDCHDRNSAIHPDVIDYAYDGIDSDCINDNTDPQYAWVGDCHTGQLLQCDLDGLNAGTCSVVIGSGLPPVTDIVFVEPNRLILTTEGDSTLTIVTLPETVNDTVSWTTSTATFTDPQGLYHAREWYPSVFVVEGSAGNVQRWNSMSDTIVETVASGLPTIFDLVRRPGTNDYDISSPDDGEVLYYSGNSGISWSRWSAADANYMALFGQDACNGAGNGIVQCMSYLMFSEMGHVAGLAPLPNGLGMVVLESWGEGYVFDASRTGNSPDTASLIINIPYDGCGLATNAIF